MFSSRVTFGKSNNLFSERRTREDSHPRGPYFMVRVHCVLHSEGIHHGAVGDSSLWSLHVCVCQSNMVLCVSSAVNKIARHKPPLSWELLFSLETLQTKSNLKETWLLKHLFYCFITFCLDQVLLGYIFCSFVNPVLPSEIAGLWRMFD